jgi:hypothetical protein
VPLFALRPAFVPVGGDRALNRTGYHQQYVGFELGATKAVNHWMAHAAFSVNSWREHFRRSSCRLSDEGAGIRAAPPLSAPTVVRGAARRWHGAEQRLHGGAEYSAGDRRQFNLPFGFDGPAAR